MVLTEFLLFVLVIKIYLNFENRLIRITTTASRPAINRDRIVYAACSKVAADRFVSRLWVGAKYITTPLMPWILCTELSALLLSLLVPFVLVFFLTILPLTA